MILRMIIICPKNICLKQTCRVQTVDLFTSSTIQRTKIMKRDEILRQAETLINGDRAQDYGDAKENFQDIGDLWSVFLKTEINAEQVAVCMILMKCARLMKSNHMDGWVDICGYAALGGEK